MIQRRIAQQALTYRGDNDRVGNSFSLDGANEALFIKFVVKKNSPAKVKKSHRRLAARVEVKRKYKEAPLFISQPLANSIVERAERIVSWLMIQPFGKPVVPEVIMMMNGCLPSTSIPLFSGNALLIASS